VPNECIEVIVVDDGSIDNTQHVVKSYQDVLTLKYFFQDDRGNRTAAARNLGIENAEGDIIIFIDSGVLLGPRCVEKHLNAHRLQRNACAVVGYVYGFDQKEEDFEKLKDIINTDNPDQTIKYLRTTGLFPDMRESFYTSHGYSISNVPAPWAFFITCNCSVHKSTLCLTGCFDENLDYHWGVEDLELGYRLNQQGVKFLVERDAEAIHYPHPANMKSKFEDERINKVYFHQKHNDKATELFLECGFLEINEELMSRNQDPINRNVAKNTGESI